jgi:hypothetical protein
MLGVGPRSDEIKVETRETGYGLLKPLEKEGNKTHFSLINDVT